MRRATAMLLAAAAVSALPGCSDATAPAGLPPDDYVLPPPDPSLDPERLSVGELLATPCAFGPWGDGLDHLRDRHEWATVDVYFGRDRHVPDGPPSLSEILRVRRADGRVLHTFELPVIRARMLLSRIPALIEGGGWVWVRDVPDASRYDLPVIVGFRDDVGDRHEELFRTLGGRVDYRWDFIAALAGPLPDRSIPELRSRASPRWVETSGVGCVAADPEGASADGPAVSSTGSRGPQAGPAAP